MKSRENRNTAAIDELSDARFKSSFEYDTGGTTVKKRATKTKSAVKPRQAERPIAAVGYLKILADMKRLIADSRHRALASVNPSSKVGALRRQLDLGEILSTVSRELAIIGDYRASAVEEDAAIQEPRS